MDDDLLVRGVGMLDGHRLYRAAEQMVQYLSVPSEHNEFEAVHCILEAVGFAYGKPSPEAARTPSRMREELRSLTASGPESDRLWLRLLYVAGKLPPELYQELFDRSPFGGAISFLRFDEHGRPQLEGGTLAAVLARSLADDVGDPGDVYGVIIHPYAIRGGEIRLLPIQVHAHQPAV